MCQSPKVRSCLLQLGGIGLCVAESPVLGLVPLFFFSSFCPTTVLVILLGIAKLAMRSFQVMGSVPTVPGQLHRWGSDCLLLSSSFYCFDVGGSWPYCSVLPDCQRAGSNWCAISRLCLEIFVDGAAAGLWFSVMSGFWTPAGDS